MVVQVRLPQIDYTARDFESIKQSLVTYLEQRFPDDFTDFTESQLGVALLELVAYQGSILSFMLDRAANESYIETARERRSVIKLAALLGYKLSAATASSVTLQIQPETGSFDDIGGLDPFAGPVVISKGTKVNSGDVIFEVDQDYTFVRVNSPSQNPGIWTRNGVDVAVQPTINAIQGETFTETFVANGSKFLQLRLSRDPYIEGTAIVKVAGVTWAQVDSLVLGDLNNSQNSNIYELIIDEDDFATIRFGDGVAGNIPSQGSTISVEYRTGGGIVGNVASLSIDQTIEAENNGQPVQVAVYNADAAAGGTDRESIEKARFFAPQTVKTNDRLVTYNDYFILCNGYSDGVNGSVGKAGIIVDNSDGISNHITVYIWAINDRNNLVSPVSESLKNSLQKFLDARRMVTVAVTIEDGSFVDVPIEGIVTVDPGVNIGQVRLRIENVLADLFREERVRYGNEVRYSWIVDSIQGIEGVSYVHITAPDPTILTGTAVDIERDTLPSQVGLQPNQILLDSNSSSTDNFYCNYRLFIEDGQASSTDVRIIDYDGTSKIATLEFDLEEFPSTGDTYVIYHPRRIRIPSLTGASNDFINNRVITITAGPGAGQTRTILDYQHQVSTGQATGNIVIVDRDWTSRPGQGSQFRVLPDVRVIDTQALRLGTLNIEVTS
jgi:hypothetical protein